MSEMIKIAIANRRPTIYISKTAGAVRIGRKDDKKVDVYECKEDGQLDIFFEPGDFIFSPFPMSEAELSSVGFRIVAQDKKSLEDFNIIEPVKSPKTELVAPTSVPVVDNDETSDDSTSEASDEGNESVGYHKRRKAGN